MEKGKKHSVYCSVAVCDNPKYLKLNYHRFPRDPELRRLWIHACRRKDGFNPNTGRICSIHFLPTDYKRDLKNELLGLPTVKRLYENAIPSQNLFPEEIEPFYAKLHEQQEKKDDDNQQQPSNDVYDDVICEPDIGLGPEELEAETVAQSSIHSHRVTSQKENSSSNPQTSSTPTIEDHLLKRPDPVDPENLINELKQKYSSKSRKKLNAKAQSEISTEHHNVGDLLKKIRKLEKIVEKQRRTIERLTAAKSRFKK